MKRKSFFFIGDLIKLENSIPVKIFDNFYIKPANEDQIKVIKGIIDNHINTTNLKINKYETSYTKNKSGGYSVGDLNKEDWKYFIVESTQVQAKKSLVLIFSLLSVDLSLLFEAILFSYDKKTKLPLYGSFQFQLRTVNYFHDSQRKTGVVPEVKFITKSLVQEIKDIEKKLSKFNSEEFPFIQKALNDFISIKDISANSPFKILSCFAILELLLTTYKQRTSNDNSISNQLRKKINLVNNQLDDKIDFKKYFKGSNTNTLETIIEKLYQFRNDIAHGNLSDFESELRILKNQGENILYFLIDILKKILIFSLENPQLVKDLKEC